MAGRDSSDGDRQDRRARSSRGFRLLGLQKGSAAPRSERETSAGTPWERRPCRRPPRRARLSVHPVRSEEHTSELQSLMRISYAVFCLKKKKKQTEERTVPEYNVTS